MYKKIESKRGEIVANLKLVKSRATKAAALSFLGNIYYRECSVLPDFLGRYSTPQVTEDKIKKYISDQLRCPHCKERVVDYFKKYVKNT